MAEQEEQRDVSDKREMRFDSDVAAQQVFRQLQREAWENSEAHGWHKEEALYSELTKVLEERGGSLPPDVEALLHKVRDTTMGGERTKGVPVLSKLALITSEVSEALEVFRNKAFTSLNQCYEVDGESLELRPYNDRADPNELAKSEGFGAELADVQIRLLDLAEELKVDLASATARKMRFNRTRPFRHGGKLA